MTLTIICPDSKKYRPTLIKALNYIGLNDYQILDPAHDDLNKEFCLILYVAESSKDIDKLTGLSQKMWHITPPYIDAPLDQKQKWIEFLRKIQSEILILNERDTFKKTDMPNIANLQEFLNGKKGQLIEITLPDRRKMGIYPDSQKTKGLYDIEYHASTIANIAKLFQLFDASEIVIKEI